MKIIKEFREFAVKGNMIDMSIGVLVGTAFGKIIDSFIADILMPPIGLFAGKMDFSNLFINLSGGSFRSLSEAKEAGAATINYGVFIYTVMHFLIVSFAIFITIRQINKMRREPIAPLKTKQCPYCRSNIAPQAVRCPQCTSILSKSAFGSEERGGKPKITIKTG